MGVILEVLQEVLDLLRCIDNIREQRWLAAQREAKQGPLVETRAKCVGGAAEDAKKRFELVRYGSKQVAALRNVPAVTRCGEDVLVWINDSQFVSAQHARKI